MTCRAVSTTAGSVDPRGYSLTTSRAGARAAAILCIFGIVVAACGPSTTDAPRASVAAGSAAPSASVGPVGSGPSPQATPWPGNAVIGIVGLGAGDNEIAKAVADFSEAVAAEDLVRMRGAAGGLENLLTGLNLQVDRIAIYAPMAGLVDQYHAAFGAMIDGSRKLRTAIDAADANGILTATQRITEGMALYGQIRGPLSAWVEQATEQQRLLVK
jgi:hypothetical protein